MFISTMAKIIKIPYIFLDYVGFSHFAPISKLKQVQFIKKMHLLFQGSNPLFFSTNLGASRFPDSTCENPEFLLSFEIGKTKGRLTLLHGPCLQTHKVWAKNKCYDRLNPLHTATQRVK